MSLEEVRPDVQSESGWAVLHDKYDRLTGQSGSFRWIQWIHEPQTVADGGSCRFHLLRISVADTGSPSQSRSAALFPRLRTACVRFPPDCYLPKTQPIT